MSPVQQVSQAGKGSRAVLGQNRSEKFLHQFLRDGSQEQFEIRVADGFAAVGNGLIKQTQGVTHTPFTGASQGHEAPFLKRQLILRCYVPKSFDDFGPGDPTKVVMLTSRENRRGDFVNLRCRKDEHDMCWWFFKCL